MARTSSIETAAECHGVKVPAGPMINPDRAERINKGRYEGAEIAGTLAVIRPGDHVLEMGAGIGLVGAIAAKAGKAVKVRSFEANPNLIEHITALYKLNRLSSRMKVHNQVLLSDPDGPDSVTFHVRSSYLGSSLIERQDRRSTPVDVPTARYADVHADFAPDVLLMDIEGGELDFLRHANLDGIRAIVVEFHPENYGIDGMRECKSILENAGFTKLQGHCTRLCWTCTYDADQQPPLPHKGWSRAVQTVENAVVVPPAEARQSFVQAAGVLNADGSHCAAGALWRNGRALTVAPDMPKEPPAPLKGKWLWGGVLWMHFGHFLVESTARLWALEQVEDDLDGVLFIPKRPRNGSDVLGFQQQFLGLMGSNLPIKCVDAATQVETLIVPGQGFGLGRMIDGTPEYRDAITSRLGSDVAPEGAAKLYISRSALPTGRGNLIGEPELEQHLSAAGYTIYHPQKHNLQHQIATYKAAKQIIAAEGSSLHLLAMVARADQHVAIVVRRPSSATVQLERHLHSFADVTPTTLHHLTRSWKPRGPAKPRLWMGELDMPGLQAALQEAGFIDEGANWPALSRADIEARLGDRYEEVA